jgi:hypothetical protein
LTAGDVTNFVTLRRPVAVILLDRHRHGQVPAKETLHQVSKDGGQRPLWAGDGTELIYVRPGRMLMAVKVTTTPGVEIGPSKPLFPLPGTATILNVAVHPDGNRLLIPAPLAAIARRLRR